MPTFANSMKKYICIGKQQWPRTNLYVHILIRAVIYYSDIYISAQGLLLGYFWHNGPSVCIKLLPGGRQNELWWDTPGPEVIKLFSCSTQLSMKFFLLINIKMPTVVGILTVISGKNSILGLSEPIKSWIYWYFYTYEHLKFHAQLNWAWKKFYNLGARLQ